MTGAYTEVEFQVAGQRQLKDILISDLADLGFESFMDSELGFCAYIRTDEFVEESLSEYMQAHGDSAPFEIRHIPPQNWNALWESQFDPIRVGTQVYIRAPFHEPDPNFQYDLLIEPKMSFGTGHHATTRLMCEAMLKMDIEGKEVCDMGCGTGILAILAGKLHAKNLVAIDIEDWAVENSIENAARNSVDMEVILGDASSLEGKQFDVMLANINRNILVNDFKAYKEAIRPGGTILLSGFLEPDVLHVDQAGRAQGFEKIEVLSEENWRCMRMQLAK